MFRPNGSSVEGLELGVRSFGSIFDLPGLCFVVFQGIFSEGLRLKIQGFEVGVIFPIAGSATSWLL